MVKMLKPSVQSLDMRTVRPSPKPQGTLRPGFYGTRAWKDMRDRVQRETGMQCEKCRLQVSRMIVDHIVEMRDGGAPLDRSNLMGLCYSCHAIKTRQAGMERV